ncbi:LssY C-terminal domain-containing protein [soil metagenome]
MISLAIRFAKRLAVLVPGLVIAYLSIFNIFPWLNDHLPAVAAILITYVLAAYIFIPAIIRLFRIISPPKHLPLYCVTRDGFASDPLNIGIIGTREEVRSAMIAAGWHEADKISFRSATRLALSTVYGWTYANGPMSGLYLFGRRHDLGFQIPITGGNKGSRHHVRFWAATYQDGKKLSVRSINWQHRQAHVRDDRLLWVGAASLDIGVTFIRHNAQLTHLVDPNTDSERDLIAKQLQDSGQAKLHRTIKLGEPYKLINIRGLRGHLHTDGRMTILEITAQKVR